jgi:hypothetical protein
MVFFHRVKMSAISRRQITLCPLAGATQFGRAVNLKPLVASREGVIICCEDRINWDCGPKVEGNCLNHVSGTIPSISAGLE